MTQRGRPPSLVTGPVLDALAVLRHATPAQIVEHLEGAVTLKQARKALSNAMAAKIVQKNGLIRGRGVNGGSLMSTYWLAGETPPAGLPSADTADDERLWRPRRDRTPKLAYPSVFHYAQGIAVTLRWTASNDSTSRRTA
jgi:hypothetical protein